MVLDLGRILQLRGRQVVLVGQSGWVDRQDGVAWMENLKSFFVATLILIHYFYAFPSAF